jgi:hypothetical protein
VTTPAREWVYISIKIFEVALARTATLFPFFFFAPCKPAQQACAKALHCAPNDGDGVSGSH